MLRAPQLLLLTYSDIGQVSLLLRLRGWVRMGMDGIVAAHISEWYMNISETAGTFVGFTFVVVNEVVDPIVATG